jgi:hypothetical protein
MMKKTMSWSRLPCGIVAAALIGLFQPVPMNDLPVLLAGDGDIAKECGCPSGWVAVAGGTQCLNTRTEEIIPYCRDTNGNA